MNYQDEMNDVYQFYVNHTPEVENPFLDKELPYAEQLVMCKCFAEYRVFVNGCTPVPDTRMDGVYCPRCGSPAKEYSLIAGHSAGCFNVLIGTIFPDKD